MFLTCIFGDWRTVIHLHDWYSKKMAMRRLVSHFSRAHGAVL